MIGRGLIVCDSVVACKTLGDFEFHSRVAARVSFFSEMGPSR